MALRFFQADSDTGAPSAPTFVSWLKGMFAPTSPVFTPVTVYKAGQLVVSGNALFAAKVDFTSGATINLDDWTATGSASLLVENPVGSGFYTIAVGSGGIGGTPGSTAALWAIGQTTAGAGTWASASSMLGAQDGGRATYTTAIPGNVGTADLTFDLSTVPSGATITSVVLAGLAGSYTSSMTDFPYTYEIRSGSSTIATPQSDGNGSGISLTFTGITYAQLAAFAVRIKATHSAGTSSETLSIDSASVTVHYTV